MTQSTADRDERIRQLTVYGLKSPAIAERLGMSQSAVRAALYRVRKHMAMDAKKAAEHAPGAHPETA